MVKGRVEAFVECTMPVNMRNNVKHVLSITLKTSNQHTKQYIYNMKRRLHELSTNHHFSYNVVRLMQSIATKDAPTVEALTPCSNTESSYI